MAKQTATEKKLERLESFYRQMLFLYHFDEIVKSDVEEAFARVKKNWRKDYDEMLNGD